MPPSTEAAHPSAGRTTAGLEAQAPARTPGCLGLFRPGRLTCRTPPTAMAHLPFSVALNGRDFPSPDGRPVPVEQQVDMLIRQARSHENLAQHYSGWCAFW